MAEKEFVDGLLNSIKRMWPEAVVLRAVDKFSLGVPDVLAWISMQEKYPWTVAIEAKSLDPWMSDPFHRGRRTGMMLKHPFTGPQISKLRELKRAGVDAFGLIRVNVDTAFRIEPADIPTANGNFTHEDLVKLATVVPRRQDGVWQFWSSW